MTLDGAIRWFTYRGYPDCDWTIGPWSKGANADVYHFAVMLQPLPVRALISVGIMFCVVRR